MSDTFNLIQANHSHTDSLLFVWDSLYQWHHQNCPAMIKSPCLFELEQEIDRYLSTPDCYIFAIENGDQLCGFITGQLCKMESPLIKTELIGTVDHWFVMENARNNGVGKALFNCIEREFIDCGAKRINVEVWGFNIDALEAYKRLGFKAHIHCMTKTLTL
ncbi:GNAT family N-acetyltransferase [Vibrio sp. UCD-FRSSP16_10]|uniref:GNAT family N-acetyltransferase n=1 Tax=unclassified Vibrio TaxID=2614977 RepID=UPI0007FBD187|nr:MULTISPECIES: GNAT family N-acetyltransferase [unclassified Vibrio]OBT13514.1 GNAT family N-acetyltransferase [Vibrio sp. UCD-FRSSP16_30]OBT19973.1 GNAT family N-acetyltransferase [Vibrio sp. UCD-FRSSP16_10]